MRALTLEEFVDDDLTKVFPVRNPLEYTMEYGFFSPVFEKILPHIVGSGKEYIAK